MAPNAKNNDFGNDWLKMHSAGSGAYKSRVYQPHQAIVLEANASSPTGAPKIKSIIIKNVPDPASRRLLVQQGDADVARDLGADQIAALQDKPGVKVLSIPSAEQNYLVFNTANSANPLLNNPAFWEAARWLVDYEGITKNLLKGQYFIHQSFLPAGLPGALETNPFTFDPQKAKAILDKAGIKDAHFTLDVENKPPFITIAQSLQASFAQGGVKVDLLPAAGSQVYARVRAKQHQAAIRLWIPDYFDAHSNASAFAWNDGKSSTVAGLNGWQIPELNKATLAAVAEPDPAKRLDLYKTMQETLLQHSPYVFIDQGKTQIVVRDNVKGYQQGLNADMVWYDNVTSKRVLSPGTAALSARMTDSSPGPGRHRAAGYNADIPGISIFHAIVFHSPYPPAAGAVYAAAHAVRAVAGHLLALRAVARRPRTADRRRPCQPVDL